jgi:hypothetical protein
MFANIDAAPAIRAIDHDLYGDTMRGSSKLLWLSLLSFQSVKIDCA